MSREEIVSYFHYVSTWETFIELDVCVYIKYKKKKKVLNLTFKAPGMKMIEFANSDETDERPHDKPSYLDLLCLPYSI